MGTFQKKAMLRPQSWGWEGLAGLAGSLSEALGDSATSTIVNTLREYFIGFTYKAKMLVLSTELQEVVGPLFSSHSFCP
jgi:hypothetical protein